MLRNDGHSHSILQRLKFQFSKLTIGKMIRNDPPQILRFFKMTPLGRPVSECMPFHHEILFSINYGTGELVIPYLRITSTVSTV